MATVIVAIVIAIFLALFVSVVGGAFFALGYLIRRFIHRHELRRQGIAWWK